LERFPDSSGFNLSQFLVYHVIRQIWWWWHHTSCSYSKHYSKIFS